jgi:hypothetical protein
VSNNCAKTCLDDQESCNSLKIHVIDILKMTLEPDIWKSLETKCSVSPFVMGTICHLNSIQSSEETKVKICFDRFYYLGHPKMAVLSFAPTGSDEFTSTRKQGSSQSSRDRIAPKRIDTLRDMELSCVLNATRPGASKTDGLLVRPESFDLWLGAVWRGITPFAKNAGEICTYFSNAVHHY